MIKCVYFTNPVQVQHTVALRRYHVLSQDEFELTIKGNWLTVQHGAHVTRIPVVNISSVIEDDGSD